jgi:hypothetical protein
MLTGMLGVLLAVLAAGPAAIAGDPSDPASRYRIVTAQAKASSPATSTCGRYAIAAESRYAPEARSRDGRYALKAVNLPAVGCDPFPDPLFQNGFESP